jgi:hypothetical protein
MSHDSARSRRADAFDHFRRTLVLDSKPIAGEDRESWFKKFKELLEASFPEETKNFRKPGLATRLVFAEVETPGRDKEVLHDVCQELDVNWQAMNQRQMRSYQSFVYLDRLDAVWEWCADLGGAYVTGAVKLRNAPFVSGGGPVKSRPSRPWHDRDRPPRRRGPTSDTSQDPSGGLQGSDSPRPWRPHDRKGPAGGDRGRRPFGPARKRPYRPKDKG